MLQIALMGSGILKLPKTSSTINTSSLGLHSDKNVGVTAPENRDFPQKTVEY